MPKTNTPTDDLIMFTVRVPSVVAAWLDEVARLEGSNRARLSRRIFEDAATFYGLPAPAVARLKEDAKKLGIKSIEDPRDYILNLLMMRYSELGPSSDHDHRRKP